MKETIIVHRTLAYTVCRAFCRLLTNRYATTTVTGLENIPKTGPAFLVSNHVSTMDSVVIGGNIDRYMAFISKQELFDGRFGWWFRQFGAIPFRRGTPDPRLLRLPLQHFKAGNLVGIFPEGTRSETGKMGDFLPGFGRLAARFGVPIIPIGLIGTEDVMPLGSKLPRPGRITMNIGRPIPCTEDDLEGATIASIRRLTNQ